MPMQNPNTNSIIFAMNRYSYLRTVNTLSYTNNGKALPAFQLQNIIDKSNNIITSKPVQSSSSYSASSYIESKRRNAIGKVV